MMMMVMMMVSCGCCHQDRGYCGDGAAYDEQEHAENKNDYHDGRPETNDDNKAQGCWT